MITAPPTLADQPTYQNILTDLQWLARNVRLDPAGFADDHLAPIAAQLADIVTRIADGEL